MSIAAAIEFPCEALPEDPALARLLGVYPQRQDGLFMQRVRLPGGRIEAGQLRALASIAERRGPGYPLHLTTRQEIEFHGLRREDIPAVQREIQSAGLTSLGACGDTLRNLTCCPGAGRCPGTRDVSALCDAIGARAGSLPWIHQLPRKFKISISGCPNACARPWINDVGLVAQTDGTIRAVVAGSLGARPATGILFDATLSAATALPFVVAALRLFHAEGDRANRSRARLRHVRERMGDAAFVQKLNDLFKEELRAGDGPGPDWAPGSARAKLVCRLRPPLGDLAPALARELAGGIAAAGAELRIGFEHDLLVYGKVPPPLTPPLQQWTAEPRIVSCPGTAWCSRGLADSRGTAASIRAALPADCALGVSISGCPNNCSHASVADIGLVGRIRSVHGARQECYRLFAGGGAGKTANLANELHPCVPAARVPETVRRIADEYVGSSGERAESFGAFVSREKARISETLASRLPLQIDTPPPARLESGR
jgi:sulfite reductase beta subunit-like hemoprotein